MTEENPEELKPLEVKVINQKKEKSYEGEESYQYEDLNPSEEELEEDFGT